MKNIMYIFALCFVLVLRTDLYAQATIEVSGTIKSKQGVVQGAQIDFLDLKDEFKSNAVSSPGGKFKSAIKFQVGRSLKLRVSKTGYETLLKVVSIEKAGDVGELMLAVKNLSVSGFVKDSVSGQPLQGVEVFFYDQSKLIQSKSTNSLGYFDLESNLAYGQKISIRFSKKNYYDKEESLVFTSDGINKIHDILMPEIAARGLKAFIRVTDKKTGNAITGVHIHYFDQKRSSYVDDIIPPKGELELRLYQAAGTSLDFQLSKNKYRTIQNRLTLSENPLNNVFTFEIEKRHKATVGTWLLIATGISALIIGLIYGLQAVI